MFVRVGGLECEETPALVFLERGRLRAAAAAGHLDEETLRFTEAAMDSCGIPDGLPVITVGGTIFEPAWRWQRAAPQSQALATCLRYMRDVRRLVQHLGESGIELEAVTGTDLRAFAQRRRGETAAATCATEEAALVSFFGFCTEGDGEGWRVFKRNPWPMWRTAKGTRSALRRAPDTVASMPRFLDDDELRHFLLAGLGGVDPETGRALGDDWAVAAPLLPDRDLAFASLMVATGARMTEARLVLVDEIPTEPGRRPWPSVWMRLGGERAKTRGGEVPFDPEVGRLIGRWYRSDARAEMVQRAQPHLKQMLRDGRLFVVDDTVKDARGEVTWRGRWLGERRRFTTTTLSRDAAYHAVRVVEGRIEPLTLWQGWRSGGLAVSPDAFEEVFREAALRAAAHPECPFAEHLKPVVTVDAGGHRHTRGGITAHMLRHSAAVRWMVELEQELARRDRFAGARTVGLPPGRFNSLLMVQAWLRHRRYATTVRYQTCYLSRRWVERHLGDSLRLALTPGRSR